MHSVYVLQCFIKAVSFYVIQTLNGTVTYGGRAVDTIFLNDKGCVRGSRKTILYYWNYI